MSKSRSQEVISTEKTRTEVVAFAFAAIVAVVAVGCPASKPATVPPGEAAVVSDRPPVEQRSEEQSEGVARLLADKTQPVGSPCASAAECMSGLCEGQGCTGAAPGICVDPNRPCADDEVLYCACDGQTFGASSTCPGELFESRGACEPPPSP